MASPRKRRGEPLVRRVLDAALQELARVGLKALSVPEVAARAGVNKTSVYRRWPTKQQLVRAALEQSMEHTRALPDTGTLEGDLAALAGAVAGFITSPRGTGVLRTVFADGSSRAVRSLAASMWASAGDALPRQAVARAVARGELPPEVDPELLLFTLAGALLHRVFIERAPVDEGYLRRLIALVTRGVAAAPRGRRPARVRAPLRR